MALSKSFRKNVEKNFITGISDPDNVITSGNYALNFLITGNFHKGFMNKRTVLLYGLQGSGKSYLASLAAKNAQEQGYDVIYIDTERALTTEYLEKVGVNMDEDRLMVVNCSTLEEIAKFMSEAFKENPPEQKIAYIVDSLGMLDTEANEEAFEKNGEMKNDMGLFAKKLKQFMKNMNKHIGARDNYFIATGHAYQNQDLRNGKGTLIVSGGEGFQFTPSVVIQVSKLKLKEGSDVKGIRMTCEIAKSRFNQLGGKATFEVPYTGGLDPYDGMVDLLEDAGMVSKSGSWYSYKDDNGDTKKFQRKSFKEHLPSLLPDFEEDKDAELEETDEPIET